MRRLIAVLQATLLLLPALAQASPWYDPDTADDSVQLVTKIFGSVVDAVLPGAGGAMPQVDLGPMFMVFNAAVMAFGAMLVTYGLVVGTMQTAHDGEVLGKRWSSVWVPIRSAAGMGAVIPLASGYSVIQMIVIWFALQGVGVANLVWGAAVNSLGSNSSLVGSIQAPDVTPVASGMLKAMACAKAMNAQFQAAGLSTEIKAITIPAYTSANGSTFTGVSWGDPTGQYSRAMCGNVTWKASSPNASQMESAVYGAQTIALQALVVALDPLATKLVAGEPNVPKNTFLTAIESYRSTLLQTAQTALSNTANPAAQEFVTQAREGGWVHAGEYYMVMARINSQAKSAMDDVPQPASNNLMLAVPTEMQPELQYAMGRVDTYLKNAKTKQQDQNVDGGSDDNSVLTKPMRDAVNKLSDVIMTPLFSPPSTSAYNMSSSGAVSGTANGITALASDNALLTAKFVGNRILDGVGLVLGLMIVAVAGSASSIIGTLATIATTTLLGTMFSMIFLALASFGAMLAVYLPIAPYVIWIASVGGWLVFLIEAVIAAPLWAVMHAKQEGEGFAGSNTQGYMLLMSLIMRPALMIFGFIIAVLMVNVLGGFLNATFARAYTQSQSGTWFTGLFIILGSVVVYTTLVVAIVNRSFALIHIVPDRILRWVGGGAENLGEGEMQAEVSRGATGGVAGVINTSSGAVGKVKELGARKAQAENAKKTAEALQNMSPGAAAAGGESAPHLGDNTGGGGNNGGGGGSGGGKGGGNEVHSAKAPEGKGGGM